MPRKFSIVFFFIMVLLSCNKEEALPKPKGQLRLGYPSKQYKSFNTDCSYSFQLPEQVEVQSRDEKCWYTIHYPNMKASIYLTYSKINKEEVLPRIQEAEKMVYEHTIKASNIEPKVFINPSKKVYGTMFDLDGESASNVQFYVTDSVSNFMIGDLYFKTRPNPDSLAPAIAYIKEDMVRIMETLTWK